MGRDLHAARGAGREDDVGVDGGHRRLHGRRPRRTAVGRDGVAGGVVDLGDAVAAELVDQPVRAVADDHRVHRPARPLGEGARERDGLPRHLARAVSTSGLDEHEDHRATPSFSSRSTTAFAASGPSPSTSTALGWAGGSSSRTRPEPRGSRCGATVSTFTFFAFIRPEIVG